MKYALWILFLIGLGLVIYGYQVLPLDLFQGRKIIGVGVVIEFALVMPLFIWYRYRNKNLEDFIMRDEDFLEEE